MPEAPEATSDLSFNDRVRLEVQRMHRVYEATGHIGEFRPPRDTAPVNAGVHVVTVVQGAAPTSGVVQGIRALRGRGGGSECEWRSTEEEIRAEEDEEDGNEVEEDMLRTLEIGPEAAELLDHLVRFYRDYRRV